MNFEDTNAFKKGEIGEQIVVELLTKWGYLLYAPIVMGSHKIDFFAHKIGKENDLICVEAKAKKRRGVFADTGFNANVHEVYTELMSVYKIKVYVMFIDDFEKCVYGNFLDMLGEGKIINGESGKVIVFSLDNMNFIRKLSENELKLIAKFTKTNMSWYENTIPYFKDNG